jgi:hypothetical protein
MRWTRNIFGELLSSSKDGHVAQARFSAKKSRHAMSGFRDLTDSLEELSNDARSIDSVRRLIAAEYKLFCEARNLPFTSGGLREYYGRRNPGDTIDSSTFSKIMRWARTAKPSYEDVAREL